MLSDQFSNNNEFKKFKLYCKKSKTTETLEFFLDVEKFKSEKSNNKRVKRANNIFKKYIVRNSKKSININEKIMNDVQQILHQLNLTNININLFEHVEYEVKIMFEAVIFEFKNKEKNKIKGKSKSLFSLRSFKTTPKILPNSFNVSSKKVKVGNNEENLRRKESFVKKIDIKENITECEYEYDQYNIERDGLLTEKIIVVYRNNILTKKFI